MIHAEPTPISRIARQLDRFEVVDPQKSYSLLGMHSRIGGPFVRETKLGAEVSATKFNRVATDDFIYSRLFAWQGSFGLVPSEMDDCYVSNEFPIYELDREAVVPAFLLYWFGLPSVQKRVEADCSGSTPGTRNRFKESFFEALEIPLPPLSEQRRIAAKIDALAAKIDEARRLRDGVLTDARALLRSRFAQIIEGADYRPMAEIAPIVRRPVEIEMDGEYPELGVRSFHRGTFFKCVSSGADIAHKKMYHIEPGDLVFSNIMAWEGAIAVARPEDKGRIGVHRFISCVPADNVATSDFLGFYFETGDGFRKIVEASPATIARNRTLSVKKLEAIEVPIPPYAKQLEFNRLQAQVAAIQTAQASNQTELDALLPSILDRAFKGEL